MIIDERAPGGAVNKNVHRLNSISNEVENEINRTYDSEMVDKSLDNSGKVSCKICNKFSFCSLLHKQSRCIMKFQIWPRVRYKPTFWLLLVLYEYTNKEQDLIKNAFRIGTFNSIRDLPNEITPFSVTHNLKVKVQDTNLNSQITSHNSKIYREILKQNGGVF